jgi:hypothetical protein
MSSGAPHSDLEVVSNRDADAPEVQKQVHAYYSPEPYNYDDTHKIASDAHIHEQDQPRTICGLQKRTFWIILIIVALIIVAAIGGGIGGALASNKHSTTNSAGAAQSSASSQLGSSSTTPTPTSAEPTTPVTTTAIVGPSSTIMRDCPSSNNTLYSITHGDSNMQFRKTCEVDLLNVNGIQNTFGRPVASLNECIDLCGAYNINNRTQIQAGKNIICNAVCWRNTFDKINDWPGGMCFGFTTRNTTSGFRYTYPAETRCDSAALINQDF